MYFCFKQKIKQRKEELDVGADEVVKTLQRNVL